MSIITDKSPSAEGHVDVMRKAGIVNDHCYICNPILKNILWLINLSSLLVMNINTVCVKSFMVY